MERNEISKVIDTMNVMDRARALQGMHQAMLLGNVVHSIASGVRHVLTDAGRAMTAVYGRAAS
jgi:hypothetical protein